MGCGGGKHCVNKEVNELLCIYITCRAAPKFSRGEC